MWLAAKLSIGLLLIFALTATGQAVFHVGRVVDLHEREARDDLLILGRAVRNAVVEIDRITGAARARSYVEKVDERREATRVRLVPKQGSEETTIDVTDDRLKAELTVHLGGTPHVLELIRPLSSSRQFGRSVVRTQTGLTIGIVVMCGLVALAFGFLVVGRRVESLIDQTRRVAAKNYVRNDEDSKDELGRLGRALNVMVSHLEDADALIRTEKRRRTRLLEQLRHADRLSTVGKIASGIAHELGTPLNVISGYAQMIAQPDASPQEVERSTDVILEQTSRMTDIIRQLLDFSRRDEHEPHITTVGEVLEQTQTLMEPIADEHEVEIVLDGQLSLQADVDTNQILQVLTNLTMNAVHATSGPGTVTLRASECEVDTPEDDNAAPGWYVVLDVIDQGSGIAPEDLEHVFEPFFTTKRPGRGTGLGLSVCHGIVRDHGGWLEVDSTVGRGSRFSVYLPKKSES